MFDIIFIRHGESEGNAAGLLQGRSDLVLSENGKSQARQIALRWQRLGISFDKVITSPLQRARQTAQIIADLLGVPLEVDLQWIERSFGSLEGRATSELNAAQPPVDFHHPYQPIGENGETQVDLYLRAMQGVQNLLQRVPARYLVVTHGAMLSKILFAVLGISPQSHGYHLGFQIDNTGYVHLRYDPQSRRWQFRSLVNPADWISTEERTT